MLGVSGHESIEDAKHRAELSYPGISRHWKDRNVTLEEALHYYDDHFQGFICSFCGKRPYEHEGLVRGSGVQICRSCVEKFYAVFNKTGAEREDKTQ